MIDYFESRGHTERRACKLASLQRSTCRYQSRRQDGPKLVARLRKIAEEQPRFGYRRIHALLRREGFGVDRKRVYYIYCAARLAVKRRTRRKLRAVCPMSTVAVTRPNERWSMDYLGDGRKLRTFNVVDAFTASASCGPPALGVAPRRERPRVILTRFGGQFDYAAIAAMCIFNSNSIGLT